MSDGRSLIQQRIALGRRRTIGLVIVVASAVLLGVEVALIVIDSSDSAFRWFTAVMMLVWLAVGISQVVVAERRRRRFEAERGRDAGKQEPVR
ncbi:MAG: hypothetical protein EPO52_12335 [Herbiconiux sp.]|uniref:hypothetical protein n=1 Tax=Herbiconiux sp. TaxID=1871186 RepID=UPI00120892F6|nr:hypothetical protein [Herbiconiux sp.]TAJ47283.1 MAG: hypothetical protein EPO52_12335 [Herbiconiux sp.]